MPQLKLKEDSKIHDRGFSPQLKTTFQPLLLITGFCEPYYTAGEMKSPWNTTREPVFLKVATREGGGQLISTVLR